MENGPSFSLGGCFNLSELAFCAEGIAGRRLCLIATSTKILSTLDPKKITCLKRIKLMTACIHECLSKVSQNQITQAWSGLDIILSELAKALNSNQGKKLNLVLALMQEGKCMSFGRKWLPELLPRFSELGELRVEYEQSRSEAYTGHRCFCDHETICQKDFHATSH